MFLSMIRKVYLQPKLIAILFLGFASGLPLALTFSTLYNWLAKVGIDRTTIGIFAFVAIPYSCKFLWSFIFDSIPLPYLTNKLGMRRGWIIFIQMLLIISVVLLGYSDPIENIELTAILSLLVAFLSASQDIVIDAYRIELLKEEEFAAGAVMATYGYRIALLVSGGGALILSDYVSWCVVYTAMAGFILVGVVTVLLLDKPISNRSNNVVTSKLAIEELFVKIVIDPFMDFTKRNNWLLILMFILFYKLADAFLGAMANPFYVEMGFTNTQIGLVVKTFGLFMTLFGAIVGGLMSNKLGIMKTLLLSIVLQVLSNLFFILLLYTGNDIKYLYVVIAVENITGAIGNIIIVVYLSSLCNKYYTDTQYALLSSISSVGRTLLAIPAGYVVDKVGWEAFFLISAVLGIPAIMLFFVLNVYNKRRSSTPAI
jgi:MFS transporter, PAT family, beta-lactamase induction signal transducer AmpG